MVPCWPCCTSWLQLSLSQTIFITASPRTVTRAVHVISSVHVKTEHIPSGWISQIPDFIASFFGFNGMYYFRLFLPLKAIMDSSTATVPDGLYTAVQRAFNLSINGRNLCNLSCPSCPRGGFNVLSLQWMTSVTYLNRLAVIIALTAWTPSSGSQHQ